MKKVYYLDNLFALKVKKKELKELLKLYDFIKIAERDKNNSGFIVCEDAHILKAITEKRFIPFPTDIIFYSKEEFFKEIFEKNLKIEKSGENLVLTENVDYKMRPKAIKRKCNKIQ